MVERDRRLSIRIANEEWDMLHALAEREGISASDYIRLFIRRTYAETIGPAKPAKKPKRTK
jgi:predicted DNA-binding protein